MGAAVAVQQEKFLRFGAVAELIGLSRSTIWRMEQEGKFPKRVQLGSKSVAWRLSDLNHWMSSR
ncbi:AlpA family phage regulatory protein [Ectopseudomonas hydrolytica]|uniref:AlpA family phage regulatory protein n=1 Tax=Ectopseudomonas hydrolytica TaxID=2493633 RepID=A0ABY5AE93_9GAMM|nr:AlpA family phage regulatory protein [Pseudomonas hydrolytica]USR42247.1 AlpA family phage regulatory protein [Pseudomonas hydrolytica]